MVSTVAVVDLGKLVEAREDSVGGGERRRSLSASKSHLSNWRCALSTASISYRCCVCRKLGAALNILPLIGWNAGSRISRTQFDEAAFRRAGRRGRGIIGRVRDIISPWIPCAPSVGVAPITCRARSLARPQLRSSCAPSPPSYRIPSAGPRLRSRPDNPGGLNGQADDVMTVTVVTQSSAQLPKLPVSSLTGRDGRLGAALIHPISLAIIPPLIAIIHDT